MKRISLLFTLSAALVVCAMFSFAQVRLPAIIGSHMVLQQNSEAKIWGWCDPNEKITVTTTWDTTTYTATGSPNARWSVQLKTPAAGGPYKISIKGNNSIELEDVMIGEV